MLLPEAHRRRPEGEAVAADEAEPADQREQRDRAVHRVEALEGERHRVAGRVAHRVLPRQDDAPRHPGAVLGQREVRAQAAGVDPEGVRRRGDRLDDLEMLNEPVLLRYGVDRQVVLDSDDEVL